MTATKPQLYTGEGSAIDNYLSLPLAPSEGGGTDNSNSPFGGWGAFDKNNTQHKTILSLLRQAQWVVSHPRHGEVADLERLSAYLKSPKSPIKKPLKSMTPEETSKIIQALKGIVKSKYK
jgi:hypothetical protein